MGGPILIFFIGVCVNMFLIYRTAAIQQKKTDKYRFHTQMRESRSEVDSSSDGRRFSLASLSSSMTMPSRGSNTSRLSRKNQVLIQSLLYFCAFLITHIWTYILRINERKTGHTSFVLCVFARIFQPLLGSFNMLIYTRSHVATVRRFYADKNWFQAFFFAVRFAGDNEEFREDTAQIRMDRRREKQRRSSQTLAVSDSNVKAKDGPEVGNIMECFSQEQCSVGEKMRCDQEGEKREEEPDVTPKHHNPYFLNAVASNKKQFVSIDK